MSKNMDCLDAPPLASGSAGGTATDWQRAKLRVALLTAGRDRPYALGLGAALAEQGIGVDYIGSPAVDGPEVRNSPLVRVLHFRDQREDAGLVQKMFRVTRYYLRLLIYTWTSRCPIFHVLWNNKFEVLDRTLIMALYRLAGRRVLFTAHNVNAGQRDGTDSKLNRWSLGCQYRLAHRIFVHTELMKSELAREFAVPPAKIAVIPFGINNTVPTTQRSRTECRNLLGLAEADKVLLFFGNIAPYKGLEFLVEAFVRGQRDDPDLKLIIAGKPKGNEAYWKTVQQTIARAGLEARVLARAEYISDADVEVYFKAADVVVLPYNHIFQSGVLFLGYSFGVPVIATDVGSLREEIVEGETGWICRPQDPADLLNCLRRHFASELHRDLPQRREGIRRFANERYSWRRVGEITKEIYQEVLR